MTRAAVTAHGEIEQDLLQCIDRERTSDGVPGVGIGVLHEGRIATSGLGVADVRTRLAVDGETLFQIGSVTKTFTGTALLQLVDAGEIDLDDPLAKHLPDFRVADPTVSREVTIRDCVTHSPGWDGDVFADTGWGDDALAIMVDRMRDLRQVTPRARMWAYNNAAFYPLGRILEVVHGRSYEEVIRDELFAPLGMDAAFFFAQDVITRPHALGHASYLGEKTVVRPWAMPRSSNPVGGIVASAQSMMSYARFQIEGATDVLSDARRRAAFESSGPAEDAAEIGVGWWLEERGGHTVISHGGGANGQPCHFAMVPSKGFAITILTNAFGGGTGARRAISWAIEEYLGLPPATPTPTAVDPSRFDAEALGDYECYLDRWSLFRDRDGLFLDSTILGDWLDDMHPPTDFSPSRVPVRPIGDDRIVVGPGERWESVATLLRTDSGEVGWLRHHLRAGARLRTPERTAP